MDSAMRVTAPPLAEAPEVAILEGQTEAPSALPEAARPEVKPYPWILNPFIDVLFCCGGLLWVVFAAHIFNVGLGAASENAGLVLMAILGTHVFSESHTAATLFRVYGSEQTRTKLSFYTKWAALACFVLCGLALKIDGLAAIFTKIYLVWVVQHFMAQTYGIALIYCYKRGYIMSPVEKYFFKLMIDCTTLFAILRQFTYQEWGSDTFLGQQLPFIALVPEPVFMCVDFLLKFSVFCFACMVMRRAFAEHKLFPLPAMFLVFTGVVMFVLGKELTGALWLYVPAFYHGTQYLVVTTSYYLKERGLPEGVTSSQIGRLVVQPVTLRYLGFMFMIGIFIYVGVPGLLEQLGVQFTTAFAAVFCVINFHHFLTDAAIWRLRDPQVRKILVS